MAIDPKENELKVDPGITSSYHGVLGKPLVDSKTLFAHIPKPVDNKKKNREIANKFAPNKDKPTTADAENGIKNLPAVMASKDPQGLSSIAPMMYQMLGQIAAASSGSSQSKRKQTMQEALTGALSILSNKYTFEYLTSVFDKTLDNDGLNLIDERYRSVVVNALANLYKNYIEYGEGNIPVTTTEIVKTIGIAPTPLVVNVPDLYIQQYYGNQTLDLYPGYIKWVSQDGTEYVYTERSIGEPYYLTADEEVYSLAEQELAVGLEPYIIENNLTPKTLNELLAQSDENIEQNSSEKTGGKNSSKNLMSILMQLAGYAGQITNLQQSIQLPVSVLNKGSIQKSQEEFLKNIGQLRQEKDKARNAVKTASPTSLLSSISNSQIPSVASKLLEKVKNG